VNLDADQIGQLVKELRFLSGEFLQKVYQPHPEELVFEIRIRQGRKPKAENDPVSADGTSANRRYLLFSIHRNFSRLHLLDQKPNTSVKENEGVVPASTPKGFREFKQITARHLVGSRLESISQENLDRTVVVTLSGRKGGRESEYRFIAELMGVAGGFYLVDEDGVVLTRLTNRKGGKRDLAPGKTYRFLEKGETATFTKKPVQDGKKLSGLLLHREMGKKFNEELNEFRIEEGKIHFRSLLTTKLKALSKRLKSLQEDQDKLQRWRESEKDGEILKTHFHRMKKGMDSIVLPDAFKELERDLDGGDPPKKRTIPLDPACTPQENVERYFQKAKKSKRGMKEIEKRQDKTDQELESGQQGLREIDQIKSQDSLNQWEEKYKTLLPKKAKQKTAPKSAKTPSGIQREFHSSDGLIILVGKNDKQNDEITFRIARGNDLWFHVRNFPGSHVVLLSQKGHDIPRKSIEEAAMMALFFSSRKKDGKGDVIYTKRKYVRKPKGAPVGTVTIGREKNIFVRLDPSRLDPLLGKEDG